MSSKITTPQATASQIAGQITGQTAILLMLADPVAHIRGSALINARFAELGLDAAIVPLQVAPADLGRMIDAVRHMRNVAGLGITIPHKIAVIANLDDVTLAAKRAGAVNFVRRDADGRLTGTNTDGAGFLAGLRGQHVEVAGQSAVLAGAGGVARAIAFALADAGLGKLRILNRDHGKAAALARDVQDAVPDCEVLAITADDPLPVCDLLINGTALGMKAGEPLPVPPGWLRPDMTVAEVVISPARTALLAAAQACGCRIVSGAEMLRPQPDMVADFLGLKTSGSGAS